MKGLDKIIVGAAVQSFDAIVQSAQRGDHEHWQLDALATHGAHDRKPVDHRQHAVDDREIVAVIRIQRVEQAGFAVAAEIDAVVFLFKRAGDQLRQVRIVFDEQKLEHDHPSNFFYKYSRVIL